MYTNPDEVFRKDVWLALFTWGILELACFVIIPFTGAYAFSQVEAWLWPSLVLGPVGAVVVAFCSKVVLAANNIPDPRRKQAQRQVAQVVSLFGFLGLALPLLLAGWVFGREILTTDWQNKFTNTNK
ncbi:MULTISPECIES: hypothetical protein [unclassified Synechococcus]|jgi:hypothetical protein|uniref:hypothetical protein n=1 Tax=unclassified Synechococcus TaxID=2626047 RepID=UPI0039C3527E